MEKKAEARITLDHDDGVIRAKSWLKGKIYLNVHQDIECAGSLTVDVLGRETTLVVPPSLTSSIATSSSSGFGMSEHVLFHEKILLHDFENKRIETGVSLGYPFSIYMPGTVPPSMKFEDEKGSCCVEYFLKAKFCAFGHEDDVDGDEIMQLERALRVVGAPLSSKPHPYTMDPVVIPIESSPSSLFRKLLSLDGDGTGLGGDAFVVLGAKLDNTHVGKGQTIDLAVAGRCVESSHRKKGSPKTDSSSLTGLEISLLERIEWTTSATQQEENDDQPKQHTEYELTVLNVKGAHLTSLIKEAEPGEAGTGHPSWMEQIEQLFDQLHQQPPPKVSSLLAAQIQSDLATVGISTENASCLQISVPVKTLDSYEGSLVKVTHSLRIVFVRSVTDSVSEYSSVSIPIKVFDPPTVEVSNHRRLLSREKIDQVKTTTWPEDEPAILSLSHHRSCSNISNSMSKIDSIHEV